MRQHLSNLTDTDHSTVFHFPSRYFAELEICHLGTDSMSTGNKEKDEGKKFEVFTFRGEGVRGRSAGGCGNTGGFGELGLKRVEKREGK